MVRFCFLYRWFCRSGISSWKGQGHFHFAKALPLEIVRSLRENVEGVPRPGQRRPCPLWSSLCNTRPDFVLHAVPGSDVSHQVLSSVMLYETITCKHVMVFLDGLLRLYCLHVCVCVYISNMGRLQSMLNTCQLLWKRAPEVIQHVLFWLFFLRYTIKQALDHLERQVRWSDIVTWSIKSDMDISLGRVENLRYWRYKILKEI